MSVKAAMANVPGLSHRDHLQPTADYAVIRPAAGHPASFAAVLRKSRLILVPAAMVFARAVSYTHLTLPTNREV